MSIDQRVPNRQNEYLLSVREMKIEIELASCRYWFDQ